MSKKARDFSDAELAAYSERHLLYEIQMLVGCARLMGLGIAAPNRESAWTVRNLPTEGFAIHVRNIVDFLYPRRPDPNPTDVLATLFINEGTALPPLSAELHAARRRADKEVGHLTTARRDDTDPNKPWPVETLLPNIFRVLTVFVGISEGNKLDQRVRDYITVERASRWAQSAAPENAQ